MKRGARTNIQLRGAPASLAAKLRARSRELGKTMSQLGIEVLERGLEQPTPEEWLEMVRGWKPIPVRPGADVAKAVREARRIEEGLEP